MKTEYGYKLFERKGDQIFPLFIDKSSPIPVGEWVPAENHPTKGFAKRPGWHIGMIPDAPWLKGEDGKYKSRFAKGERVWCEVEFDRTIDYQPEVNQLSKKCFTDHIPENGFYIFRECGKGDWVISGSIRVVRILSEKERQAVLVDLNYDEQKAFEKEAKKFAKRRETKRLKEHLKREDV